jgi:hypothetical protein
MFSVAQAFTPGLEMVGTIKAPLMGLLKTNLSFVPSPDLSGLGYGKVIQIGALHARGVRTGTVI